MREREREREQLRAKNGTRSWQGNNSLWWGKICVQKPAPNVRCGAQAVSLKNAAGSGAREAQTPSRGLLSEMRRGDGALLCALQERLLGKGNTRLAPEELPPGHFRAARPQLLSVTQETLRRVNGEILRPIPIACALCVPQFRKKKTWNLESQLI